MTPDASNEEPCGCRWLHLALGAIRYERRCETHAPMCRNLEQWEVDLLMTGGTDKPTPLEAAMYTVWLCGDWQRLTARMTPEQREAAADAVLRYTAWYWKPLPAEKVAELRWWRP